MEPRHYLATLIRRWPTLAVLGLLGLLGSGVVTYLTPTTYTSTTALLFSVPGAAGAGEVRQDAQYVESAITSLIKLTTSSAVLGPVAADEGGTTTELARTLSVVVIENTRILEISATRGSGAEATRIATEVAEQLQDVVSDVSPGVAGQNVLMATTIEPATQPRFQTAPDARRNGLLGALLGLLIGVILVQCRESLGTRLSSMGDLALVTTAPLWPIRPERPAHLRWLPRSWISGRLDRQRERRTEDLRRLGLAVSSMTDPRSVTTIRVEPARPKAHALATQLTGVLIQNGQDVALALTDDEAPERREDRYPDLILASGIDTTDGSGSGTTLVSTGWALAVVELGSTTRQGLGASISEQGQRGHQVLGIVVADQSPDLPVGIRAVLRRLTDPGSARGPRQLSSTLPAGQREGTPARSTVLTALAAVFLAGMAFRLPFGTTTTLMAAMALAPVWISTVRRYRHAAPLLVLAGIALACGILLADSSSVDHAINGSNASESALRFLAAFAMVGLILWARTILSILQIAVAYGAGTLVTGVTQLPGSPNPWKFLLAFGVTVIALALIQGQRRASISVGVLLAIGVINVLSDFRSGFAFCAVAAGLVLWQARPRIVASKQASRALSLLFIAVLGAVSYAGVSYAFVGGYLGDELQERSVQQIENSGSLIAGGRPEWTVTWALMQDNPWGFGVGVVPNAADVLAGKEGFATVNVEFQPEYAAFLFGGQFKLHSVIADLWSNFGPAGIALGLAMAVTLVVALSELLARRQASALLLYLVLNAEWSLAFGPIYSDLPDIALALGLVLSHRAATDGPPSQPASVGTAPRELRSEAQL